MATKYWEHRAELRQLAYDRANNKVVESVSRAYDRTMRQLDTDIDSIIGAYTRKTGLTASEAMDFLREGVPPGVMDDLRSRVAVITNPRERKRLEIMLRTDAYRARISRTDAIKASTRVGLTEAAEVELKALEPHLRNTASLAYNRSLYDIQHATSIGFQGVGVPRRALDTILKSKWAVDTFSQSVWANRDATYNMMSQAMSEIVGMGKLSSPTLKDLRGMVSIDKWKEQLKSKFKKESQYRKYAANRLIRTESAYVANQTTATAYEECGIERYEYMATLDSRTSEKCGNLDGQIFDLDKKEVGVNYPPAHPHCRSSVAPVIDGLTREGLTRAARDKEGKSAYVPRDMNYNEWKAWQDAGCPDIKEWRKGGTALLSKQEVIQKVHDLQDVDGGKYKRTPFPEVSKDLRTRLVESEGVFLREENNLGIQDVKLDDLYTKQSRVMEGRLVSMVENDVPLGATKTQDITVVFTGGKYVIIDGNHRATLAKLFGRKKITVQLRQLP